jgi:hypothetical protein
MKKNKGFFWNDGVSLQDFEKLLLGFLLFVCVFVGAYKYLQIGDVSANWTNVIFILGGLFTARKVFSYFKNEYYKPIEPENEENRGDI